MPGADLRGDFVDADARAGGRAKCDAIIRAGPLCGRDYSRSTPQRRVEDAAGRASTNAAATIRFTVASGSTGSVVAPSPDADQRVLLRASKLLDHVLACQRLPYRPERFLIHEPHRTPARGVLHFSRQSTTLHVTPNAVIRQLIHDLTIHQLIVLSRR